MIQRRPKKRLAIVCNYRLECWSCHCNWSRSADLTECAQHLSISPCFIKARQPILYPHIAWFPDAQWWICFLILFRGTIPRFRESRFTARRACCSCSCNSRVLSVTNSDSLHLLPSTARLRSFKDELIMDLMAQWHMLKRGESNLDSDLKHHDIAQLL